MHLTARPGRGKVLLVPHCTGLVPGQPRLKEGKWAPPLHAIHIKEFAVIYSSAGDK